MVSDQPPETTEPIQKLPPDMPGRAPFLVSCYHVLLTLGAGGLGFWLNSRWMSGRRTPEANVCPGIWLHGRRSDSIQGTLFTPSIIESMTMS